MGVGNKLFWAEQAAYHYSELSRENIKQPYEGMHWFLLYKKQFRTDYPAILNLKNINLINKICLLKYNMISQLVIKHNTVFIPLKTIYRGYVIVLTSPV